MQTDNSFIGRLKHYLNRFDKITSNNGNDWILALTWIMILEFISSILEFQYLDVAQSYVYHIQDGILKELFISALFVLFIWFCVYSIVFMYRKQFLTLALYGSICAYLSITHDITFNLLIHNLNPQELFIDGFGLYMVIQIILKAIITYLFIKMLFSIKNTRLHKQV